jgi:hypothetical protein
MTLQHPDGLDVAPVDEDQPPPTQEAGAVNTALYELLESAARAREFVFYGRLGADLKLQLDDRRVREELWQALSDISRREVEAARPMLSSVCVQEEDHLPGPGFYALGRELGLVLPDEDEVTFAVRQIRATHDYWSELEPFGETGDEA